MTPVEKIESAILYHQFEATFHSNEVKLISQAWKDCDVSELVRLGILTAIEGSKLIADNAVEIAREEGNET